MRGATRAAVYINRSDRAYMDREQIVLELYKERVVPYRTWMCKGEGGSGPPLTACVNGWLA